MSNNYDFDVTVIGSGPGGYVAAIRAAQLRARTCVVERAQPGGVCTNSGCIPTKVLWQSARTALRARAASEFGVRTGEVRLDYGLVAARRKAVVQRLRGGVRSLLSANGVEMIAGSAQFTGPYALAVNGADTSRRLTSRFFILATGSVPAELPHVPFDHEHVIDSADALDAGELPESVLIVGGGYIGCEFAGIYAAFGVKVTVVEMLETLLPGLDPDCGRELARALRNMGAALQLGTSVESVVADGRTVTARLSNGTEVSAARCLVCVGRRPHCSGLALEAAGVAVGPNGELPVNEHMQTNIPHVYAVGDVTARAMLAHVASQEGTVAARHAMGTITAAMDYGAVPACVFAFPEVATVGMTEAQARDAVGEVTVKKFPFTALGKAHVLGETAGFVKMVADAASRQLLGVHICGPEASALLGEACLALRLECTAEELADTVHAHPTLCESIREAADGVAGFPVNWRG
jgi:dihydrolipoamide dehydrogenase